MGVTVVINYMTASHKGSGGLSPSFPDVCKTPTPGGPIPIPYPNIAQSSDLADGSKKVKFDGASVTLKGSNLSRSMGDEAGTVGGVVSNVNMGKAQFVSYSFDVKVEGQNVCRLLDPTTNNMSSMNATAFAHLQTPANAAAPPKDIVEAACLQVQKKLAAQQNRNAPAGGPKSSGIIRRHWRKMREYVDANPNWVLYFRKTAAECGKWIKANHEPKLHEVLDGNCLKEVGKFRKPGSVVPYTKLWRSGGEWLLKNREGPEFKKAENEKLITLEREGGVPKGKIVKLDMDGLAGIVVRTGTTRGTVQRANRSRRKRAGKWMTGDYDLMDILAAGARVCERPKRTEFFWLKRGLNKSMGWPGIQHPHQSVYNTRKDKEFKVSAEDRVFHFNNLDAIDMWLGAVQEKKEMAVKDPTEANRAAARKEANIVPATVFAKGRKPNNLVDKELTALGPNGGFNVPEPNDFWDALVCCGCLDKERKKQDPAEIETGTKEERTDGETLHYERSRANARRRAREAAKRKAAKAQGGGT
jgi:hypothetical protein